ncbi:MAG: hypothetical protein J1E98_11635 [Lachnospiraceae bacterium]|nr:hypothetical protein [Lachnospiraceae bacterium]
MSKLASKVSKRIMAAALSAAMIMSNMTVFASEIPAPEPQTKAVVEDGEIFAEELSLFDEEVTTVEEESTEEKVLPEAEAVNDDSAIGGGYFVIRK